MDVELNSTSKKLPTRHTFCGPRYPKNKKYLIKCDDDVIITFFSGISCFRGSGFHQKYAVWVRVGCGIKFCIQQALPIEIWVKTQWDISKIWTKKVVFFYDTYPQIYIKKLFKTYMVFIFKEISLPNTWWHGFWIRVERSILSWNFL